jgi:PII-like signaling protein
MHSFRRSQEKARGRKGHVKIVWRKSLCVARIYPMQGAEKHKPGLIGWFSSQPLVTFLAEDAIEVGLLHVCVTYGHIGYLRALRRSNLLSPPEMSTEMLPTALEIVGEREQIETFLLRHGEDLQDGLIVVSEGVEAKVSPGREAARP